MPVRRDSIRYKSFAGLLFSLCPYGGSDALAEPPQENRGPSREAAADSGQPRRRRDLRGHGSELARAAARHVHAGRAQRSGSRAPHAWAYSSANSFFPDYDIPARFWWLGYRRKF